MQALMLILTYISASLDAAVWDIIFYTLNSIMFKFCSESSFPVTYYIEFQ